MVFRGPRWRNHTGNQSCRPRSIEEPRTADDLVALVQRAEALGTRVRAVGTHHAWSDVALTDGFLVEPARLGGALLSPDCPRETGERLAWVLAGTPLRELNQLLDRQGLALENMGGYDAQTVAGVVSTSTHGSGLRFGPFPDAVRSLDLVVARGERLRIEPADGPTDPDAFAERYGQERTLVQDDSTFEAAICGMGCLGVIHSLALSVRPRFWLNERRHTAAWEDVRDDLTEDGLLARHEHYELFVNPYPRKSDGKHTVLVTIREPCSEPVGLQQGKLERHPLTEAQSAFPLTWVAVRLAARWFPSLVAGRFEWLLDRMCDDGYAGASYRVLNIGEANKIPAYSSELAVSLEGGRHIEAVDRILAIAAERRREGLYHTSPFSLRFVAPSRASASMMQGRPTMMIELILAKGTRRWKELLGGYEAHLADLAVRPHWGQYNELSPQTDFRALYPRWDEWLDAYERLNSTGVFDSPFTDRIGISRSRQPARARL